MENRLLMSFDEGADPFALRDFLGILSGRPAVVANLRQHETKVFFTIRCKDPFDREQTRQIERCYTHGRHHSSTSSDKAKTQISMENWGNAKSIMEALSDRFEGQMIHSGGTTRRNPMTAGRLQFQNFR